MKTLLDLNKKYTLELGDKKYHLDYVKPEGIAGRGGSSIVYKAQEEGGFNDFVVIKEFCPHELTLQRMANGSICIPENKDEKEEYEKRKLRALSESKIVDKLRHNNKTKNNNPYIFPYSDPIEANNTLYTIIATESGDMLSCMIHNGFFNDKSFPNICDCILKILDALEPIHDQGYLHLDISPDNIHFSELGRHDTGLGIARLIDFNSAFRPGVDDLRDWNPTFKKGYSAHELAAFDATKPLDLCPATDLYSVAAIFFELLIERPPQADDGDSLDEWPQWISESGCLAGASNRLIKKTADLLWKGLSSWPKNRFKDVEEMRTAVEELKSIAQKRKVFLSNAKTYSERQFKEWKEKNEIIYSALYGNDERIPMTVKDGDNEYNINTLLAKLESQKCRHAVLVGEGGMGKTFTCMLLGERHLKEKLVLYIPLCDYSLDRPIKKNIMRAFGVESDDDYEYLIDEEEMLILLDGFNEIKSEFAHAFFMELRDLKVGEHIQTLITSRTDILHVETANFAKLSFVPISDEVIDAWLEKYTTDNQELDFSQELYKVLSNPMLLKIYAVNTREQKLLSGSQKSKFLDNPVTAGEIIWNFLEHQIIKAKNIFEDNAENEGFGIIFFRFLLPYIAYQLESTEKSSFTLRDLKKYIGDFHSYFKTNCDCFGDLIRYEDTVTNLLTTENKTGTLLKWCTESFCIIKLRQVDDAESETYDFIHQHFRDIFSAIFIKDQMEELQNKSVFSNRVLPYHVSQMLMEILQEHKNVNPSKLREYLKVFKGNFDEQAQIGVHNCLKIIIKARNGDLSDEDLSNLDLRKISLNGNKFSNQDGVFVFDGSFISDMTFLPQGHSISVDRAIYSPDSNRMLSYSYEDRTIKEWDREIGNCIHTLVVDDLIANVNYSDDGKRILVMGDTLREMDIETGECLCIFDGYVDAPDMGRSAEYSPDGQCVLAVSDDCTIMEWDRETGECLYKFNRFNGHFINAVYSIDGKKILAVFVEYGSEDEKGSNSSAILEYNKETKECLRIFIEYSDFVYDAVYSPNSQHILTASNNTIKEWDRETGQCLHTFGEVSNVSSMTYSQDGQRIRSIYNYTAAIKEWDRETEECLHTFGEKFHAGSAVYSLDGRTILSTNGYAIEEWDRETGQCLRSIGVHSGYIHGAVYSQDGKRVLSDCGNTIREWDTKTGCCLRTFYGHSKDVYSAEYSPDGQRIISSSWDDTIKEWDRNTGQCLNAFTEHHLGFADAIYSPDGKRILINNGSTFKELDRETGCCLRTFEGHSGTIRRVIYSPNGQRILSSSNDSTIKEWDRKTGECLCTYIGHSEIVYGVVYSPDGRRILSASSDNTIKEWDRETGLCLRTFTKHSEGEYSPAYDIAYSPDGRRVLSNGGYTIKEWDKETELCLNSFIGRSGLYSPDGKRILIFGHTIEEWNRETGQCLWKIAHYDGIHINGCSFKDCIFSSDELEEIIRSYGGKMQDKYELAIAELGKFKGAFGEQAQIGVHNCLRIIIKVRNGDLSGEDLSNLDLRMCPMNGILFSNNDAVSVFDGSFISDATLLPQGHSELVSSAVYSPDGHRVLSASGDKTIKEWHRETGVCLRTFEGHSDGVKTAVYSPDGLRILSGSDDKTMREWDRKTGRCLRIFDGHSDWVTTAIYSPDGLRILSVDGIMREWDGETGECLRILALSNCVHAVYSSDGGRVLSSFLDGTIREWDIETGECLHTFEGHSKFVLAVYSPDGQKILSSSQDMTIKEWDRETEQCLRTFEGYSYDKNQAYATYSPDGQRILLSGYMFGELDRKTGKSLRIFEGHSDFVHAVYSSDGQRILSASMDETIKEWDRETAQCLRTFESHSNRVGDAIYSSDGQRILFVHSGTIKEWDIKNRQWLCTFEGHHDYVRSVAYSPTDGQRILSASQDNTIKEWDRETGRCLRTLAGHSDFVRSVIYSPDGLRVLSASHDKTIKEWNLETGECLHTFVGHAGIADAAVYSPDGQRVFSSSWGSIKEWDLGTGECLHTFETASNYGLGRAMVCSQDSQRVLFYSFDAIKELDRKTGQCLRTFFEGNPDDDDDSLYDPNKIHNARYSPDGQRIIAAFWDGTIREWDRETGQCLHTFTGHNDNGSVAYSPDGKRVLFFGDIIKELDIETGLCLWKNPLYDGIFINGCSFKDCKFSSDELKKIVRSYGGK
ncbi:MAG: WD40 repeat domain-containing serine/threonine-protein kinase [Treponema sp.]|nr:WD40 repeat domain-containing serine/threonine-protein kinase [Treponema sp.]